ncbi:FIMAH domain-containing protein [Agromyces mangrovi Wang et al. 2018]|uniref:FIMAH domain-containing protein n=1 Tax=Agromyces mangrovi TaxID=1858653 RepID=UPI002573EEE8|nr:hypothetical protein [Agromyces mangrovi]BDZ65217.1 hypothetical protein GCM10025877_21550 [Agromyces mangrovi]
MPVTLTAAPTDNGAIDDFEVSVDGGDTWTSLRWRFWAFAQRFDPYVVDTEGETEVLYRAFDTGGNVSDVESVVVKVDSIAPDVSITGVADGDELGSSATVGIGVDSSDETSGVVSEELTLDGEPLEEGDLDLWTLELGEHELVAAAVDEAGNRSEVSVAFTVTTSVGDLASNLERIEADGGIDTPEAARLHAFLAQAERAIERDRADQAAAALERFAAATDDELLARDALALAEQLGG